MEGLRFSVFLYGMIFPLRLNGHTVGYFSLHSICKFCDVTSSTCTATGTCWSNCNITSVCRERHDACIAVWHRDRENVIVQTVCHDPLLPFHGIMLDDYNSRECVMKQHKALGPNFYMCSCRGDECNDKLIFTPLVAVSPKEVDVPVILATLIYIVALAVVIISMFCCYRMFRKTQLRRIYGSEYP